MCFVLFIRQYTVGITHNIESKKPQKSQCLSNYILHKAKLKALKILKFPSF